MPPDDFLRALIASEGGSITVERFMREALYHPRQGYYSRRVRAVGREGDFSTSATLHGALGRAVAAWAVHHRAGVAHRGAWHVIELGGGGGELAAEIRRSLGWWPGRGLQYHLVEISEGLRTAQRQRLDGWRNVRWHAEIGDALDAAGGRALIFSNEFVDAFPCVQLARDDTAASGWREVGVAWPEHAGHPVETLQEWDRTPFPAAAALHGTSGLPPGQRVEIHFAYRRWLTGWRPRWRAGRLLTIDYGDAWPGLYHRRPRGTLRAYCHHQRLTGPEVYRRMGQQDLTADVNFTDLQAWGEALGLATEYYGTQADFLRRWLPPRLWTRTEGDPALRYVLDPSGAGGAFKVLEQSCSAPQNDA